MNSRDKNPKKLLTGSYRLFGIRLASTFPFVQRMVEDVGIPDVTFNLVESSVDSLDWEKNIPVYKCEMDDTEDPNLLVYRHYDCVILRFPHIDFFIRPDTINANIRDETHANLVELWVLGKVLSLWLELREVPCLHASSIVMNDGAVGFLSSSHGGKSVMAASMMRAGHPLLTDDILPVNYENAQFFGSPGNPSMRMWPDQAEYFLGSYEDLDLVHPLFSKRRVPVGPGGFGTFCREVQPLKILYIPEKQNSNDDVAIEPITPRDAFFELVKNSYAAGIIEALGKEPHRMKFFAGMASQIPIRRLRYPEGFRYLSRVVECIQEDLDSI